MDRPPARPAQPSARSVTRGTSEAKGRKGHARECKGLQCMQGRKTKRKGTKDIRAGGEEALTVVEDASQGQATPRYDRIYSPRAQAANIDLEKTR